MKFNFKFKGRQVGAIGKFYRINATFTAESLGEAMWMLWRNYEHISEMQATREEVIPAEELINTALVKPKAFYTAEEIMK